MRNVFVLPVLFASMFSVAHSGCSYTVEELTGVDALQVDDEYVVGFASGVTERDLENLATELGLELVEARGSDRLAVLTDPLGRDGAEVTAALERASQTEWSEPQYVYELLRQPDDYGTYLWGLHNTGSNGGLAGADIGAFAAWDRATGEDIVIAVIDTGISATHPDLQPNLWRNPGEVADNGIDDDNNGYIDDVHGYDFVFRDGDPDDRDGHGTHVAGIAAARGDEGYGIVGTAFDARIMAVKLLDPAGGGYATLAAEAINYAVNNGADVINASWGGYGPSQAVRNAVAYARSRGVLFVAAAGNEGYDNNDYPLYPASYSLDNVISVAATDRRDRLASFSNYGSNSVHLTAPGEQILSTWPGSDWLYMGGTSMASPFVAGAAALLHSASPEATAQEVRTSLLTTVSPLPDESGFVLSGGRLDADAALNQLLATDPAEESAPPSEWQFVPYTVESSHPYENYTSKSWTITGPEGAKELRLHFARVDLETGYDFLSLRDSEGNKVDEWTGNQGEVVSSALAGNQAMIGLYTDYSVTAWGFQLSGYSWR